MSQSDWRFSAVHPLAVFLETKHNVLKIISLGNSQIRPTVDIYRMLNNRRQENLTDAGPEVSLLFRKAVGAWHTSGLLHIRVMGSPSDFPVCIFSSMAFIYVLSISTTEETKRLHGSSFELACPKGPNVNPAKYFVCFTPIQHPLNLSLFSITLIHASPLFLFLISLSSISFPSSLYFFIFYIFMMFPLWRERQRFCSSAQKNHGLL